MNCLKWLEVCYISPISVPQLNSFVCVVGMSDKTSHYKNEKGHILGGSKCVITKKIQEVLLDCEDEPF